MPTPPCRTRLFGCTWLGGCGVDGAGGWYVVGLRVGWWAIVPVRVTWPRCKTQTREYTQLLNTYERDHPQLPSKQCVRSLQSLRAWQAARRMATTASSQCFPIQAGISFAGEPCGHAELPSVEGCCALCERTPSCLFFTHWSGLADAPSRCELYSTRTDSQLAPEHATVTSGAMSKAHWLAPSAAACRFSTPEPGTLASAPLAAAQAFATLEAAQAACVALDQSCTGVTGVSTGVVVAGSSGGPRGRYRVRGGSELQQSPTGELASFKVGCDGAWCDLEEGAWYGGELLYTRYDVPSAAACCDACLATPRCVGFNYNRAALSSDDNGAEPLSCALQAHRLTPTRKKQAVLLSS